MSVLGKNLMSKGITRIFIADDADENLSAARALSRTVPEVAFTFFANGADIIEAIRSNPGNVDLVLTDRRMEQPDTGESVYAEATGRGIPAAVITSFDHHGPRTILISPVTRIYTAATIDGPKKKAATWQAVLSHFDRMADLSPCTMVRNNVAAASRKEDAIANYTDIARHSIRCELGMQPSH